MPGVVLLPPLYGATSLPAFAAFLTDLCAGLQVELTGLIVRDDGRVEVNVAGEDEAVAVRFLEREVGLAPVAVERVERFSVLGGSVVFQGTSRTEVFVDVGVFAPRPVYAVISLRRLQAQLADGKKFALERIVQLFGIVDRCPLEVRVTAVCTDAFTAELTESQLNHYATWVDSRLDRLVILGLLEDKAEEVVETSGLRRDVLRVEPLGVLEHALVCKLGTDAEGLVPRLGRRMRNVGFACVSPRRILQFVHRSAQFPPPC